MPTRQKIRYSDCDPQAIVFNGNYARYFDDAATDWLEERGFGGTELGGIGTDIVTARLEDVRLNLEPARTVFGHSRTGWWVPGVFVTVS